MLLRSFFRHSWPALMLAVPTVLLTACGGGSSNPPPAPVTSLVGGAVQGRDLALAGSVSTPVGATPETSAGFKLPTGMASDGTHLFVSEYTNHTIRKIVIATGEISILAGALGTRGSSDGAGSAARFDYPVDLASDGSNLYVADHRSHTIRKIVMATGSVSTLAGTAGQSGSADGQGAAARFKRPSGVTTDGTHVYVAEAGNHTIRRIDAATGDVRTLAGLAGQSGAQDGSGAQARFASPVGLATDGTSVYVADSGNLRIRRIVLATGEVSTLAELLHAPTGLSTDGAHLYVTHSGHGVDRIVIATGAVSAWAGSAGQAGRSDGTGVAARFSDPQGIASDGTYLYVADMENFAVRRIEITTGTVSTPALMAVNAGSADGVGTAARFHLPAGMTTDGLNLYVADSTSHTVRRIVIATGAVSTLAGAPGTPGSSDGIGSAARFNRPAGLSTDGTRVFVVDAGNHTVRSIDLATGTVRTLAGTAGQAGSANGIGAAARFHDPAGITVAGAHLYVTDAGNHTVRRIVVADATVSTVAGTPGQPGSADGNGAAAGFRFPRGITTTGDRLYVTDAGHTVRSIVAATGETRTVAGLSGQSGSADGPGADARLCVPAGITSDGIHLYVSDLGNHAVRRIAIASGVVSTVAGVDGAFGSEDGTQARFNRPDGITTDGVSLYLADSGNRVIRRVR